MPVFDTISRDQAVDRFANCNLIFCATAYNSSHSVPPQFRINHLHLPLFADTATFEFFRNPHTALLCGADMVQHSTRDPSLVLDHSCRRTLTGCYNLLMFPHKSRVYTIDSISRAGVEGGFVHLRVLAESTMRYENYFWSPLIWNMFLSFIPYFPIARFALSITDYSARSQASAGQSVLRLPCRHFGNRRGRAVRNRPRGRGKFPAQS